jgi:solute carrier family 25 (mitochondrial phosphate transporter), member 3
MSGSPRFHAFLLLITASFSQCLGVVDYRYFVAGGICAACSHGITTPIDVVKTKMQADPQQYNSGMLSAAAKIVKKDGPGILLSGLGPTVVGYGIEGSAKFGIYEILKPVFGKVVDDQSTAFILASIAAGAVAALILCPAESVRIRIVTDENYSDTGLLTGLPKLIREEGFFEMFGGFPAMLAKQVRICAWISPSLPSHSHLTCTYLVNSTGSIHNGETSLF